jgi:hypothetical protein
MVSRSARTSCRSSSSAMLSTPRGPLGHRAGAFGVACDCTSARESLVREREVPVGDPVRDADVEHSLGMVQAGLGPTQNRVYPGALPFSACKVLGRADLAPVLRWQAY